MKPAIKSAKESGAGEERRYKDKRLWLICSLAICAIVIIYTALPIFQNPQLEPDDYRYLEEVQYLKQDFSGNILKFSVIENEWDYLWWINVHEKVCFFRPIIILSYWLDVTIDGGNNPLGLLVTNILIYSGCVLLCCLIYFRWVGPGIPFLLASALFAAFFAHGEVMWYVSGRTDSLAALFLLGGLAMHIYGERRSSLRWWAVPCFTMALLTKEMTAILPPILFLSDWWVEKRSTDFKTLLKKEWKLYAVYGTIILCFFAVRAQIISMPNTGYPYPYFVTPGNPNFTSHLLGQVDNYCANLFLAVVTTPFKIVKDFQNFHSLKGIFLGVGIFCLFSVFLYNEKKYWLLVLLGIGSWLPTIIVYQSERYLFLPSFAVAGALGLFLSRVERRNRKVYYCALIVSLVWIGHQAYSLQSKNRVVSTESRLPENMGKQLGRLKSSIPKGSRLLLLNFPGILLQDQFARDQLRVQLDDPDLDVTVITTMQGIADMGTNMAVEEDGENAIIIRNTDFTPIMAQGQDQFPWVSLAAGSHYETESGIRIEILDGSQNVCRVLRCVSPHPINECILLKWDPAPVVSSSVLQFTSSGRELYSTVRILTPEGTKR
jgi:hypothetical protein